jgi:hypothetical protein
MNDIEIELVSERIVLELGVSVQNPSFSQHYRGSCIVIITVSYHSFLFICSPFFSSILPNLSSPPAIFSFLIFLSPCVLSSLLIYLVLSTSQGGVTQMIIPAELGYPAKGDPDHNIVGPK